MDFELKNRRGQRKVCFRLDSEGRLIVSAPYGYTRAKVEEIIVGNRDKIERLIEHFDTVPRLTGTEADVLFVIGRQFPLSFTTGPIGFQERFLVRPGDREQVLNQLVRIYRHLAAEMFPKFLAACETRSGLHAGRLKISGAGGRWGSCSANGSINISWRTLQLPPQSIEYVFLHELAHLKEMNHSPAFKAVLSSFLPDHAEREMELKTWSRRLPRW